MERFDDLDRLLSHIWSYVEDGAGNFGHPFGTPTFVTSAPGARTITLHTANAGERALTFQSDARAAKIEELRRDPSALFHVWDAERRQQLVLRGEAAVHTDDEVADRAWQEAPSPSLDKYGKPQAGGTPLDAPPPVHDGPGEDSTREDVTGGRENFAVVRTVIRRIDWLHTHPDGHYRARFAWNGASFDGDWVVP